MLIFVLSTLRRGGINFSLLWMFGIEIWKKGSKKNSLKSKDNTHFAARLVITKIKIECPPSMPEGSKIL